MSGSETSPTARTRGDISDLMSLKVNSYTWSITGSYKLTGIAARLVALYFATTSFSRSARLTSSISDKLVHSRIELTSILVPSYRLKVTALHSSGCRASVESLASVHSSSTTRNSGRGTSLDANYTCRVQQLKVIPLLCVFQYPIDKVQSPVIKSNSAIPLFCYSAFSSNPPYVWSSL